MDFSTILKELRESREITQDDLAKVLSVSRPTIAGYETKHRQPDYDKLIMIASFFHVSIDFLLTGQESSPIEAVPAAQIPEHILDQNVVGTYKTLSLGSKKEVWKYIQLQKLKEDTEKEKGRD